MCTNVCTNVRFNQPFDIHSHAQQHHMPTPQVTVCCFDKTGTLTSDDLLLEGVVLPQEANDDTPAPLLKDATALPLPVQRVLAGCQSLVTVEGRLVGDPLERAALTLMGWKVAGNAVSSPAGKPKETVTILHRFTFSSSLKRMAAIIKVCAALLLF